jgi:hypothetical protein
MALCALNRRGLLSCAEHSDIPVSCPAWGAPLLSKRGTMLARAGVASFLLMDGDILLAYNHVHIAGFVLGWICYSIASKMSTYMHTAPEERH